MDVVRSPWDTTFGQNKLQNYWSEPTYENEQIKTTFHWPERKIKKIKIKFGSKTEDKSVMLQNSQAICSNTSGELTSNGNIKKSLRRIKIREISGNK